MSRIRTIALLFACFTVFLIAQNSAAPPSDNPAPPARPLRVRVSTGVMLGLVEHKTMPVYPEEALKKGIQGDAVFKIEVDETGKLVTSVPRDGDPLLVAASKDALKTFRFRPYVLNGNPVRAESQLGFHFSVDKAADGVTGHVECMASITNRQ